jgi:hypothetical protein
MNFAISSDKVSLTFAIALSEGNPKALVNVF